MHGIFIYDCHHACPSFFAYQSYSPAVKCEHLPPEICDEWSGQGAPAEELLVIYYCLPLISTVEAESTERLQERHVLFLVTKEGREVFIFSLALLSLSLFSAPSPTLQRAFEKKKKMIWSDASQRSSSSLRPARIKGGKAAGADKVIPF